MARRTEDVWVEEEGRDKGKLFRITELPSDQAEMWAIRAWMALSRAGVVLADTDEQGNMWSIASAGLTSLARIPVEDAKPLLDEMWSCVKFIPDPNVPLVVRAPMPQDIEEVGTRLMLRMKVLNLHLGFSPADSPSTSAGTAGTFQAGPSAATSRTH